MKSSQNIQRLKYLKLKYGLSLLKIHKKYKKYIFRIIFYVSLIQNDKQTNKKEKKLTFLNHLLAPTFLAIKANNSWNKKWKAGFVRLLNLNALIRLTIIILSIQNKFSWSYSVFSLQFKSKKSIKTLIQNDKQTNKKEKKLTFLNHLLAPTFLAQNPKNKK
jgi:hypothetical protein